MPVLVLIVIIDLIAIVGVLYLGTKHEVHLTDGHEAAASPAVQAVLAKNAALALLVQQPSTPVADSGSGETAARPALTDDAEKAKKREEALKRKAARQSQRTTDQ